MGDFASDGRAGLDMARINIPNAIVVCVELPRMSGYSICAKLKKDSNLKTVALVITSAEATQETFEHHKKLKNRAEEYLRKPFEPETLVDVLRPYMQLKEATDVSDDIIEVAEELAIEESVEPAVLEDTDAFSEDRFHFEDVAQSVAIEPASPTGPIDQESFEDDPYEEDEVMTTVGMVPSPGSEILFKEIEQLRTELEAEREAHAQTVRDRDEAVANEQAAVSQLQSFSSGASSQVSASRDLLSIKKELHDRDKQLLELRDAVTDKERELLSQRDREMEFEGRVVQLQEELEQQQSQRANLESQVAELEARLAEEQSSHEEASAKAEGEAQELRTQIEGLKTEGEEHSNTIASQEEEIAALRADNETLTEDVTRMNNEVSANLAESASLREQLLAVQTQSNQLDVELRDVRQQAESARNALEATQASLVETEEQAARAFERIRRDGETKTKVRQALDIALRLLTEPEEENGVEEAPAPAEELRS